MGKVSCSDWDEIEREMRSESNRGSAILIGNGFSINFSERFKYQALLDIAKENQFSNKTDRCIFCKLGSANFEEVLRILSYSKLVCSVYGLDISEIGDAEKRIREALIRSIAYVHEDLDPSKDVGLKKSLKCVAKYLETSHERVYTTNYDFVLYWSCFERQDGKLKDFFWNDDTFDLSNAELYSESDHALYFLHGALHIFRDCDGQTRKITRQSGLRLIDVVKSEIESGKSLPLFVSAGDSKSKMRQIRGSDYLTFCYHSFASDRRPLVVVGHSLSDADEHIVEAIFKGNRPKLYVSYYDEETKDDLSQRLEKYKSKWKNSSLEIVLFRAEKHPLIRCADALKANRSESS